MDRAAIYVSVLTQVRGRQRPVSVPITPDQRRTLLAHVKFPMPMTDIVEPVEPVVTLHAPAVERRSSGMLNGARFDKLDEPPANTVIAEPAPSLMLTAPGEVEVGMQSSEASMSPIAPVGPSA